MPNKWDKLADLAQKQTDTEFASSISSLTRLNDSEISKIISESGIGTKDLAEVMKIINDASSANEEKAKSIAKINNGLNALISIAKKLIA